MGSSMVGYHGIAVDLRFRRGIVRGEAVIHLLHLRNGVD